MSFEQRVREIAREDGRFTPDAFIFLHEALGYTVRLFNKEEAELEEERHVTGRELYQGLEALAKSQFGPLAANVWATWGIKEPLDWGHVVFLLVEGQILRSRPEDTVEDFRLEADFEKAFVTDYEVPEIDGD
ncbi:MAG: Minf_1886 family protein [Planctomycetota bacterium]